MFNSTHTLVALAIARTGAGERVRYAAATAIIASNLPDIEIVTGFLGTRTYLEMHRGITHTLVGIPILALLFAGAICIFSGNFWQTFALALISMATHPLLDYANTYGLRPFLPFNGIWYYGDILFIFDPYIDAIFLLGIFGSQRIGKSRKAAALASLALVVVYIGARVELHQMAKSKMEAFAAKTAGVEKWAVFPQMLNPLEWDGIVQTHDQLIKVHVHALNGVENETARMDRGSWSEIVKAAEKAESADVLLRFARFPAVQVENVQDTYRVTFLDFRFYSETFKTALGSQVVLDRSLRLVEETLSFTQPVNASINVR